MLKKFVQGLVFGSGFAVAFSVICTVWITFGLATYIDHSDKSGFSRPSDNNALPSPPPLKEERKFLGSMGSYSGDFPDKREGTLTGGEGIISGAVRADDQPVEDLRLRLALNGSVMSQWGITDKEGRYNISVPYGEYRIDGYEIDMDSANRVLPGKIEHPNWPFSKTAFEVAPGDAGEGLSLNFVDPIIKTGPTGKVSLADEIVATWEPYPQADRYVVQIYENDGLHDFVGEHRLFTWSERPIVIEPRINLTSRGAPLKSGYYYTLNITAKDKDGNVLSRTAQWPTDKDFKVVE